MSEHGLLHKLDTLPLRIPCTCPDPNEPSDECVHHIVTAAYWYVRDNAPHEAVREAYGVIDELAPEWSGSSLATVLRAFIPEGAAVDVQDAAPDDVLRENLRAMDDMASRVLAITRSHVRTQDEKLAMIVELLENDYPDLSDRSLRTTPSRTQQDAENLEEVVRVRNAEVSTWMRDAHDALDALAEAERIARDAPTPAAAYEAIKALRLETESGRWGRTQQDAATQQDHG